MSFKTLIRSRGVTQQQLADSIGVHQTLVSQWCTGKCAPNVFQISKIAARLGVTADDVVASFSEG
jgi:transcriptional regulator with XRE-family HTH domain